MSFACLTHKNLVNSLAESLAVENAMEQLLHRQYQQSSNAEACRLYLDHAEVSRAQRDRLKLRLEGMGEVIEMARGGFMASLSAIGNGNVGRCSPLEVEAQSLRASYVRAQLECAMYRALLAQATSLRDQQTADLAREHLELEEAHARRLWPYVGLLTELASTARGSRAADTVGWTTTGTTASRMPVMRA
jgi:ferritin-like metal-binding protein YciE